MHDIPEEAVKAACDAYKLEDDHLSGIGMMRALEAAAPFLPVQGASAARELALEDGEPQELLERLDAGLQYEGSMDTEEGGTFDIVDIEAAQDLFADAAAAIRSLSSPDHADDLAVDRFAIAMKQKLAKKREEGRGGWENKDECSAEYLSYLLIQHIWKGDPVDIANLAMMLQQRGERVVIDSETSSIIPQHADAGKMVAGWHSDKPSVKGIVATHFGESFQFSGINGNGLILVSIRGNAGLVPVKFLLPHQLYVNEVEKLSEQGEVLVCEVPLYAEQINVSAALPASPGASE